MADGASGQVSSHNCLEMSQLAPTPCFSQPRGWGKHCSSLMGKDVGRLHLTAQSPTLPLCSSLFHPSL